MWIWIVLAFVLLCLIIISKGLLELKQRVNELDNPQIYLVPKWSRTSLFDQHSIKVPLHDVVRQIFYKMDMDVEVHHAKKEEVVIK